MNEPVKSSLFTGYGVLRWPAGEEEVEYKITVGFDGVVSRMWIGPDRPGFLSRASRHAVVLYMGDGRRIGVNVSATGHLSPDGAIEKSLDGQDWWTDMMPWLPAERADRFTLALKEGPLQVFESCRTREEAEAAYRKWQEAEVAEIRPPSGRPMRLK
jgi:hypothetical protein